MTDLRDKALSVQDKIKKDELKKIAEKAESGIILYYLLYLYKNMLNCFHDWQFFVYVQVFRKI